MTARLLPLLSGALALLGACASEPEPGPPRREAPEIRVLLKSASAREAVRVTGRGRVRIREVESGRTVESSTSLDRRFDVRGALLPRALRIDLDGSPIGVDGRAYLGDLLLLPGEGGVELVLTTDLESYLPGVLAGEMPSTFPPAALRAQAVAARTYALHRIQEGRPGRSYDVRDDPGGDQRFLGLTEPSGGPCTAAVADTRGMVLTWRSRPFRAFFHSTCGGHTADKSEVFGGAPLPPLAGGPCHYCRQSSKYRWPERRIEGEEALKRLGLNGPLVSASVLARSPDGRARTVRIGAAGPVEMEASDFRMRMGPDVVFSTKLVRLTVEGGDLVIRGAGWGHGVGMCQWGAQGLARSGASAGDILSLYYPGAVLRRWY